MTLSSPTPNDPTDSLRQVDLLDALRREQVKKRPRARNRREPAKNPHAGWKTNQLMLALARAGWGELAGGDARGLRVVLDAIAGKIVDHRTGRAFSTVPEVAAVAGYGPTWTKAKLHELVDIGVLEWRAGGLKKGRRGGRERSFFVIDRTVLVELIEAARVLRADAIRDHVAACVERLREQRGRWLQARAVKRKARSEQESPTGHHSPLPEGESVPALSGGPPEPPNSVDVLTRGVAAARANIRPKSGGRP